MKLNVKAFALTCGIIWGLAILLALGGFSPLEHSGTNISKLGKVYLGYSYCWIEGHCRSYLGLCRWIGFGPIFAWLYNKLAKTKAE